MPQRVFDVGALTIAFLHLRTEKPIETFAIQVLREYERSYLDDNVLSQWIDAANLAIKTIDTLFPGAAKDVQIATLVHLKNCVVKYDPDGKKRPKRLLGGTWFNKDKEPNHQRVTDFVKHLMTYHFLLMSGEID
jgi:hypothetical protein